MKKKLEKIINAANEKMRDCVTLNEFLKLHNIKLKAKITLCDLLKKQYENEIKDVTKLENSMDNISQNNISILDLD